MKGVRNGPKEKAVRQAIQDFGGIVVLPNEMTVRELSEEPGIEDSMLRRWACEYEEMGDDAFPGNGSPKINKDCWIVKLKKKVEELERENELLKKFRAFSSRDHAWGTGSPRRIGAGSVPSGGLAS